MTGKSLEKGIGGMRNATGIDVDIFLTTKLGDRKPIEG